MWTTVYMTQNIENAKRIRLMIEENSIIVMLRRIKLEEISSEECYELLVPVAELNDALGIIIDEK